MLENKSSHESTKMPDEIIVIWSKFLIRLAIRSLAILMVMVIWWGVADVVYVLAIRILSHPYFLLEISDILATFGAFMAVLIAIEIFVNIVGYLKGGEIQLEVVFATAYMAVLRKIIILDYKEVSAEYVYATAALAAGMAIGYWTLVLRQRDPKNSSDKAK